MFVSFLSAQCLIYIIDFIWLYMPDEYEALFKLKCLMKRETTYFN